MQSNSRRFRGVLVAALIASAAALLAIPASGATKKNAGTATKKVRGCGAFASQAEAQLYFEELGGSVTHRIPKLDPDHDGVACEGLPGPYRGYATIGFNRKRGFFYGWVTMPRVANEAEPYPCLTGNTHFPDGPRLLHIYRVGHKRDRRLFDAYGIGAAVRPASGKLVWKANRKRIPRGRYYVQFEERVPLRPFGRNECPGFSSAPTPLP